MKLNILVNIASSEISPSHSLGNGNDVDFFTCIGSGLSLFCTGQTNANGNTKINWVSTIDYKNKRNKITTFRNHLDAIIK